MQTLFIADRNVLAEAADLVTRFGHEASDEAGFALNRAESVEILFIFAAGDKSSA